MLHNSSQRSGTVQTWWGWPVGTFLLRRARLSLSQPASIQEQATAVSSHAEKEIS